MDKVELRACPKSDKGDKRKNVLAQRDLDPMPVVTVAPALPDSPEAIIRNEIQEHEQWLAWLQEQLAIEKQPNTQSICREAVA